MSDLEASFVEYLKSKANGKYMMTPKQLANEIPTSEKQQSVLRLKKRFPIKSSEIGGKIYYSVYDVMAYIMYGKVTSDMSDTPLSPKIEQSQPIIVEPEKPKRRGRQTQQITDMSHLFNLKGFVSHLQSEAQKLVSLSDMLTQYEASFSEKQHIEEILPIENVSPVKRVKHF